MPNNTMVFEPLQGLVQGAIQGHQIHQMMLRTSLDQEAAARQAYQQERDNKIEDIGIQQKLLGTSRPVDQAGVVSETGSTGKIKGNFTPAQRAGMGDVENQPYSFNRKADKSRTVEYGGRQYELKTPEEQAAEHMRQLTQNKEVENSAALDRLRGEESIKEPYRAKDRASREAIDAANNATREKDAAAAATAAASRAEATQKAADKRNQDSITSREKIAATKKANALTANAAEVKARFAQRELDTANKEQDKLQGQEQEQHALRAKIGDASKIENGENYLDPKTGKEVEMNDLRRSALTTDYNKATAAATRLAEAQKKIRQEHGFGEFAPDAKKKEATPAPAAASAYKIGQIVKRKDGSRFKITSVDGGLQGTPVN